ncbi:hypothetical protein H8356DRAFT_945808 [Neocallimastix lanati (nom. inval.)]|uniref:Translin-associated factor X-interacting protein 1 N-terminal domain-containing protein n=1 Tax=Neocallimastix californiae TaxID=1754190 RepID=A0A1Y2AXT3_9FUNG|nr:hypothetical protein H8356DRAFT_945808 [Neocallimastix sp. JGI-2020a]ORY27027.1 hypothetical protein LY90DRAFT_513564 [Neocallimastix californiae]|eukprot:ORY27027.1 hypothetical protein LY90DRAFT_513564 [Neocallimastix californiae]
MIAAKKAKIILNNTNKKQNKNAPFKTLLYDRDLFSPDKTSIPMANYSKLDIKDEPKLESIHSYRNSIYHHRDSTKPKFLNQMTAYIKREFEELGIENTTPGCLERLQVYKTVFDFFMDEFKTYRPILSEIKNEYELNLQNAMKVEDE